MQLIRHALLIHFIMMVSFFVEAAGLGDFFGGSEIQSGPCNSRKKEDIPNLEYHQLVQMADQLKEAKQFCKAVQYYKVARSESLVASEVSQYWVQIIESYFYQYDYERFFDESFTFLDLRRGSEKIEYINYLMLKGITELARLNPDMSNPYLQLGLGASPEQFNQDSPKHVLKYRAFLEKYPNSKYRLEVQSWLTEMREFFNLDYARDIRMLVMKREYAPAISRYQFLLSQGPSLPNFTLIVYECINAMREFAYFAQDERTVPSSKLARWMVTTEDKINSDMRTMIQEKLIQQSNVLLKNLLEKFPEDEWAKKALSDFGRP